MIRLTLISKTLLIILLNLNISHASYDFLDIKDPKNTTLPKKTQNPQYQMLSNTAHAWFDFHKEEQKKYLENSENWRKFSHIYEKNLELVAFIKNKISMLDQNLMTSEGLLEILLKRRLDYLYHKRTLYLDCLEGNKKYYWIATHPSSISKRIQVLQRDYPEQPKMIENFQKDVRKAIDNYQQLNLMIYHAYKLHDPVKLPLKIKQLIACSRTLWPIFQDETTDLSHPDATYLSFKDDAIKEKDGDFYEANYKSEREQEIILMNWKKQKTTIVTSSLHDQDSSVLPLLRPLWLYPNENSKETFETKKDQDFLEILLKQKTFVSHKLGKKQVKRRPQPVSLKVKSQHFEEAKNIPVQENVLIIQEIIEEDFKDSSKSSLEIFPIKEEPITIQTNEVSKFCAIDLEKAISPSSLKSEISKSKSDLKHVLTLQKPFQSQKEKVANLDIEMSSRQEFIRPNGMRLFHSELTSSNSASEPRLILNNKAFKLIDIIFDPRKKGQGFTFGQFKNLWKKINGSNTVRSDNGGSHYRLLNKDGKVVGGTFAHGDGQTYCPKTVRYLRDALYTIGVAPEDIY